MVASIPFGVKLARTFVFRVNFACISPLIIDNTVDFFKNLPNKPSLQTL